MTCTNVILAQPQAGATVDYTIPEGDSARLSFGPEDIQGINLGENGGLIISFADGGTLNIANFQQLVDGGNLLYLADGTLVDPKLLQSGLASGLTQATANDNDMIISIPEAGTVREITLEPSQNYVFAFDMTAPKKAETVDGQFVMTFDNDSKIVLTNYEDAMAADIPPSISMESKICTFTNKELVTTLEELAMGPVVKQEEEQEIIQSQLRKKTAEPQGEDVANIEPAAGEETAQQLAQIEPAAGGEAGNSGYGFNSTPGSDPFDSPDDIGPIDPTALGYRAPFVEPRLFIDTPTPAAITPVGPIAGAPVSVLDETDLSSGNLVANGQVVVDFGADGPGAITPNGNVAVGCSALGGVLTTGGVPVIITATANGYVGTANGANVFTLTIDPLTGNYTYTQTQPFDHADPADPNDEVCLTFPVLVTDDDFDPIDTTITIKVQDDAPIAEDDSRTTTEGATITGNVVTNDTLSQDDPNKVTNVRFGGVDHAIPGDGTNVVIQGTWGTLTINSTGAYSYVTKGNNPDGTDVFTYTLTDYDGDSDPANLTIRVSPDDDQPIIVVPEPRTIDETNLGPITVNGAITGDFGTDGPGTFGGTGLFTSGGSQLGGNLTHNGNLVQVTYNSATDTYTGVANGVTVFTMVIQPNGNYTFTLLENLDHADPANPNDSISLNFGVEGEDADGDTTGGTVTINVLDDVPTVGSFQRTVDETDLGPISINGQITADFGEDGPATGNAFEASGDFTSSGSRLNNTLTSGGQAVTVTFDANTGTYTGVANGVTVFSMTVYEDGTYNFQLFRPLDHADANDPNDIINLDFGIVVTDFDGDQAENVVRIRVQDDVPTIGDAEGGVDETNLDKGPLVFSDVLDHNFGLELGTITPNGQPTSSVALTTGGAAITVTQTANGYTGTANGVTIFTLTINAQTGSYVYTQFEEIDHPNSNDPNDIVTITFPVTVTSNDGDSDTGNIVIKVYDDAPVAHDDINGAEEGQTITGSVVANDEFSEDNPNTVVNVRVGGTDYAIPAGGSNTIVTPLGTLVMNSNGTYTFTATSVGDPDGTAVFTYTLRDDDGDRDTADLSIRVTPDGEPVAVDKTLAVDETNLTPGPMIFNGNLNVDFGADGQGATGGVKAINNSFSYGGSVLNGNLTSSGVPVTVSLSGNTFTGVAGGVTIFTLTINNDGTYQFQLFDHIDHADGTNPNDIIKLNFGVEVTDADGDTAEGQVVIEVYDDAPVAYDDGRTAVESQTVTGNVVTNDEQSEDNPNYVINVRFNGVDHAVPQNGNNVVIEGTYGTLTINRLGQYSYTAKGNNPDGVDTFTYTLRDFDGDRDTAELSFTVSPIDDQPIVTNATDLVDETNLRFGTITETGNITVNYGGDGPGVVAGTGSFSSDGSRLNNALTHNGVPVTVSFNSATNTYTGVAGGTTVFTLQVNANGSYSFRLLENLDHADPNDPNDEINLRFGIKATDSDGDVGTGTLTVVVRDDVPVLGDNSVTVDETNFGANISASGSVGYDFGQDGNGSIAGNGTFTSSAALTSKGQAITVSQTANGYEGKIGNVVIFTLTINAATGAYTYTQFDQIDHPNASNPDDILTLNFGVTLTEGDGDQANGTITVNVRDDGPDAVNDGRTAVEGGAAITGNVTSNDDVGADEPGTITAVRFGSNTFNIPAGGSTTVTGTYGTLVINSNGSYTYTPNNADREGTDTFTYTLRDYDGDTDTATLSIAVEIDANPVVVNAIETVDETNLGAGTITETGTVSVNYGGDGPGTVTGSGSFSSGGSKTDGTLSYKGTDVSVTYNAATNTYTGVAGGTTVFTMVINSNGSYTFKQFQQLDHADGNNPNDSISLVFGVKATDSDGDVGNGTITVNVLDDAPKAVNDSVSNGSRFATISGNVTNNDDVGEDTAGRVTNVRYNGTDYSVSASGWTTINTSFGKLKIDSSGAYTFERNGTAGSPEFKYTLRDYDGDTDTAVLSMRLTNPPPPPPPSSGDGGGDGGGGDGCPLVFDLNGDGISLISKEDSNVLFDIDEDGVADRTAWVGADDAFLVFDKNEDGTVNDHSEMFGNDQIGGYEMLASYDSNNDGVIDANDEIWSKLQIWQDLNQDGISQANELLTLDQAGFASLNLSTQQVGEVIAGNNVTVKGDVTMQDGSTIEGYDAWFKYDSGDGRHWVNIDGTVKNLVDAMGDDMLQALDGADDFLIHAIDNGMSQIAGFNAAKGDSIDLSMILEGQDDVTEAINDFVYARQDGNSTIISVDVSGSGDFSHAVDVAKLDDVAGLDVTEMLKNGNIVA